MFASAYPGRDAMDETVSTFICMVNVAAAAHARLNAQYDQHIADHEDGDEMERELDAERAFPALAENCFG